MKTHTPLSFSLLSVMVVLALAVSPANADCGSIPFRSPLDAVFTVIAGDGQPDVAFDPMDVVVYEPGQRGIILWNGEEEILLLSTDIRTSEPVSILEVIPFPSEPTVELGDFETFQRAQRLLIEKSMWRVASGGGVPGVKPPESAAKVTFHEKMGAHDVTVVHVQEPSEFLAWVEQYMKEQKAINPKIDPAFAQIITNYLDRGFTHFVFDRIETSDQVKSRQPVQYRFKSDQVYYPLEISTRETGRTDVDLLLITQKPLTELPKLTFSSKKTRPVGATSNDLATVKPEWAAFMGDTEGTLQRVRLRGNIQKMTKDFTAR
jgi:hypothetical protein